ncbi:MAG: NADPH:quinone oxidoreductase family protein [Gammaproteobacteria bacterium]|nr:NADPH:quinone oxidoreductase family protein [Gammaproteobacteria bacterium]
MRALMCHELGPADALRIDTVDDPVAGAGEVVVVLHAAGLNFPDTLAITGNYQIRPELPFTPGGEGAGRISAVGRNVSNWTVGDRVIVSGATGAFAEKILKRADEIVALPDAMDYATGAGFLAAYGTSYYALKQRAQLQAGETLLVLGAAGGVGLAAVDIGAALGAKVIAAASSEEKLDVAGRAGAAERINYTTENLKDRVKQLTDGRGADVVYDPVGGDLSEQALRATGWDGRFLVVGFAAGEIPKVPLNLCLLKSNSIVGVFYGAWIAREPDAYAANVAELFALYENGDLTPLVTQVFPLEDYVEAFATLTGRRAQGKIIFRIRN